LRLKHRVYSNSSKKYCQKPFALCEKHSILFCLEKMDWLRGDRKTT